MTPTRGCSKMPKRAVIVVGEDGKVAPSPRPRARPRLPDRGGPQEDAGLAAGRRLARDCAGDVAGERRGLQARTRGGQPRRRRNAAGGARPRGGVALGVARVAGGEATAYRGHDGVREMLRDLYGAFDEIQIEISEIRDLGDRLVAIGRNRSRGKASGADVETPIAFVGRVQERQGDFDAGLPRPRGGPRSRRASEVAPRRPAAPSGRARWPARSHPRPRC